ncbi:hypothetical protein UAJ10_07660 [Nitrospirillum sp. BR 11164]|uniref:hypothetical protein n=1 Tax=Nitrospirillum sp. BR 11164 TaxID=3104324 RepID=UPI002AFF579C|nr:hypothetical protein [Nitrospirillum sp. BR 11164]MEA1648893.1 hypothetical protein [Nitrospirillum sp. BR 11164]
MPGPYDFTPEVFVNEYGAGAQTTPSVAVMADGSYVVAWQSSGEDGSGWGIFAQRYTAAGQKLGHEFRVNTTTTGDQIAPATVALAGGGFEILWDQGNNQIYGQRYDASGAAVGGQITYVTDGNATAGMPKAVQLVNGTMLMVWGGNATPSGTTVYGQLFSATGAVLGGRFVVSTYKPSTLTSPSIAALADGGFVASWSIDQQGGDIYAQRFDATGTAVGSYFPVKTSAATMENGTVSVGLKDGGFVIVWQGSEPITTATYYDIYAQRYDSAGNAVGGIIRVNTFTTGDQSQPTVTATADGGYIVAWRTNGQDGDGYGIYAQRYDANNLVVGPEFRLNSGNMGDQVQPVLAGQADGSVIAVWNGASTDVTEIITKRLVAPALTVQSRTNVIGIQGSVAAQALADFGQQYAAVYQFQNISADPNSGYFVLNGVAQPAGALITVTSAQLSSLRFVGRDAAGSSTIAVRFSNGTDLSNWVYSTVSTVAAATNYTPQPEKVGRNYGDGVQSAPSVSVLSDGSYVVAWQDSGRDGSGAGIYAQRYAAGGQKIGGEFLVNTVVAGDQTAPSTVALADGGFEIFWTQGGEGRQVFGQRYDANGAAVGSQTTIAVDAYASAANGKQSKAVLLANGTMLVVWGGSNATGPVFYGQLFNALGTALGSRFVVSTYQGTSANVEDVSLAALPDGGFIASWAAWSDTSGKGWDVYAQRFDASGGTVGSYFLPQGYAPYTDHNTASAALKDGGYVIVWQSTDPGYNGGYNADPANIWSQRYDASGNAVGGKIQVNSYTTADQSQPAVVATADGGYIVAWRSNGQDGQGYGIYAQRYDANNAVVGGEFRVNDATGNDQTQIALAAQADGSIIAAWASVNSDNLNTIITKTYAPALPTVAGRSAVIEVRDSVAAAGLVSTGQQYVATYQFLDTNSDPDSGYFVLNGVVQAAGQVITVTSAQLSSLRFVAGANPASDTISVRINDGYAWTNWATSTVTSTPPIGNTYPVAPETVANSYVTGDQTAPSMTVLADGGYVVAWQSAGQDGDGAGIYAQRYTAGGQKVGGEFRVNSVTAGNQTNPSTVALADGGFEVIWQQYSNLNYPVFGQRYDANGAAVGSQIGYILDGTVAPNPPKAVQLANGNMLIVWGGSYTSGLVFYGQLFNALGTALGSRFVVSTYQGTSANVEDVSLAALPDGGFIASWAAWSDTSGKGWDVYAQRFDASGGTVGSYFLPQGYAPYTDHNTASAALKDGGYVIVWQSTDPGYNGGYDADPANIWSQRYDASGNAVGGKIQVNSYTTADQSQPTVVATADGGYLVAWRSNGEDGSGYGIYAQRYDANNAVVGGEFRLNDTTAGDQSQPVLATQADGSLIAAWASQTANGFDIVTRNYPAVAPYSDGRTVLLGTQKSVSAMTLIYAGSQLATAYQFQDLSAGRGYFILNGQAQPAGSVVTVTSAQLPNLRFIAAGTAGQDVIMVRLSDGVAWTEWEPTVVNTVAVASQAAPTAETVANSYVTGEQTAPSMTVLADGGYVVAWQSAGQDGDGAGIYAQRYTAGGQKVGGEFRVNSVVAGDQTAPSTVALADGGFEIFWTQGGEGRQVFGQRYDANGAAVGSQTTIAVDAYASAANGKQSKAVLLANGTMLVVWGGSNATGPVFYGQLFNALGTALGSRFVVSTYQGTSANVEDVSLAALPDGGFIASWAAWSDTSGKGWDVYAQRFDASGGTVGSYFLPQGYAPYTDHNTASAALKDGGYVIVWQTTDPEYKGGYDADPANIWSQRYDASGNAVGGKIRVNSYTTADQSQPTVVATADGGYIVAWRSNGEDGSGYGIYAQRYDANNAVVGGEFRLNDTTAGDQSQPVLATQADGSLIAAWASQTANGFDIVTKTYPTTGPALPYYIPVLGTNGDDVLTATDDKSCLVGYAGNDTLTGGASDDILSGGAGNDVLFGKGGNDTLTGGTGNDQLDGGTGVDYMAGGAGNDIYVVDTSADVVVENANEGTDEVRATAASYTLSANVENLTYIGTGAFVGIGNTLNNVMTGGAGNDSLSAGAGNDTLNGGGGADTLVGGTGNDLYVVDSSADVVVENANEGTDEVRATAASYTLSANIETLTYIGTDTFTGTGNALANTITGGAGNDVLNGGDGNDTLVGGAGADTLIGGTGNDLFRVDSANDVVVENAGEGTDEAQATAASYTLSANIEKLTYTGTGSFYGTGNDTANTLTGGAGNDTLDGGAGADTLIGGAGDDVYIVDNVGDVVTEASFAGTDEVRTTLGTYVLGGPLEKLTYIGTGGFYGTGNSAANTLTGNAGNDTLDGAVGADTLIGGLGDDVYLVDNSADVVVENMGEGNDEVKSSSAVYTLGANVEKLTYTGTAAFTGTGNEINNLVTGGTGNDVLDGKGGDDTLVGGAGNDTYFVDSLNDVVRENAGEGTDLVKATASTYVLGANIENLTYVGTGNFRGTGNDLANTLLAAGGDDTLDGGAGADSLYGGVGNDVYYIDNAGDVVGENPNGGTDEVRTWLASYSLGANLENLTFLGTGNFTGTGNGLANSLTGGAGDDTLDGGAGADILAGGIGNDTYVVDNAGDVVVEAAGEGVDLVKASVATYTLTADVDNLTYTGSLAFTGTGNALGNVITSGAGNDTLNGGAGDDTLIGGAGNDVYFVDSLNDVVRENAGEGTDEVRSSVAGYVLSANIEKLTYVGADAFTGTGNDDANALTGGAGNDVLDGAGGNDTLNGGAGDDTLIGGTGDDIFQVDSTNDVVVENAGEGNDEVQATSATYTLSANVEKLTFTGTGGFKGTGNAQANTITGGTGDDTLDGGAGVDTLVGGLGNDIYLVDDANDVVTETGAGTDEVWATASSYILSANVENLRYVGTGNFYGTGNTLSNLLVGAAGNDTLDGGAAADTMIGGAGNDVYIVSTNLDVVIENAGEGTDEIQTSLANYTLTSANVENVTYTGGAGAAGFTIVGNELNNVLKGNAAVANSISGGAGDDTMIGGSGNDTYFADSANDVVVEAAGGGMDEVKATASRYTLGANVENLTYVGSGNFYGVGNELANSLVGATGNDTLDGGAGADTMGAGTGDDVYYVDDLGDVVKENSGGGTDEIRTWLSAYTLVSANVENLTFIGTGNFSGTGSILNNQLTGGAGDDTLDGAAGVDTLIGGVGNDTYVVDNAGDVVREDAGAGTDTVRTTLANYTLGANVENLTYIGSAAFNGTGNELNNVITGGAGNDSLTGGAGDDTLDGGAGNDTLVGGTGNDVYVVDSVTDVVTEAAGAGTDEVRTTLASYTLGANVENLTYTGSGGFTGTGNALANVITGGAGADVLDGGTGADTLIGGAGDDTYKVDDVGDVVTEGTAAGTDEVRTTLASYTLGANVENLTYTGSGGFTGTGNALANVITGGAGADVLDGGAGADTLIGGAGNDTYLVDDAGDVVTEGAGAGTDEVRTTLASYTLGANVENLTYTGGGNFSGTGNGLGNVITGGGGGDVLDGGAGADTLVGGAGNDTYLVDDAGDVVTEAAGAGTDEVRTTLASYTLGANVENLTYTGGGNFSGTGNGLGNVITGGGGADVLDGGAGADTLVGGAGNDTYLVDDAGDVVTEAAGAGTDEVRTTLASYTLGANVENLTYTGGGNFSGTGNGLGNVITGGGGADVLDGGIGADTLVGGAGNDTYLVDDAGDVVTEAAGAGTDEVRTTLAGYTLGANVENLTYTGGGNFSGTGNGLGNVITGGGGADVLDGGIGADTLVGGAGNDTYLVDDAGDVVTEAAGAGTDEVRTTLASYTLGANVENLTYTGGGDFSGTGDDLDNVIIGGAGDDSFAGGLGNDTYVFGLNSGSDTITDGAGANVLVFSSDVDPGSLTFQQFGNDLVLSLTSGNAVVTYTNYYSDPAVIGFVQVGSTILVPPFSHG